MTDIQSDAGVRLSASVRLARFDRGPLAGELAACLGVDVQIASGAPCGELLRVDYGANKDHPLSLQIAFEAGPR